MTAYCPTLAKLAVNLLAMSVAASPCEGIWSIFDYVIKDKRRSWLKSGNLVLALKRQARHQLPSNARTTSTAPRGVQDGNQQMI